MFKTELIQDVKALGGLPLFVLLILFAFATARDVLAAQLLAGFVLAYTVTTLLRLVFWKQRPDKEKYRGFVQKVDSGSFPSLHSMRAAVLATVLGWYFANWLSVLFGVLAVAVGVSRVVQKRHFIRDVLAGLVLGVIVAIVGMKVVSFFF
ncbi:phosphatase PAP2 family protein [Candidatus Woesearchaeota archaeon]|nr:phosphatase PAP2 family protein [Candidatus Woesearchaeota archaeon]